MQKRQSDCFGSYCLHIFRSLLTTDHLYAQTDCPQYHAAGHDALLRLQHEVYPDIPAWRHDYVAHQIELFPEGQFVAFYNGRLVGCASSLVILWDEWMEPHTWDQITAKGTFDTHDTAGFTLYGAEVFVAPLLRGKRLGHALYEARRRVCQTLNLRRVIACGRLPGYHMNRMGMHR